MNEKEGLTLETLFDADVAMKQDKNYLSRCKKSKTKRVEKRPLEEQDIDDVLYAAINPENMKLVYLRRGLVDKLAEQPETFENKVIGSFVKVKTTTRTTTSFSLLPVTGW